MRPPHFRHAATFERLDGVLREGRAQEVAAEPFELLAVAAVDRRRGVQVHGRGREVRAYERAAVHAVIHEAATERPDLLAHPLLVPELVRLLGTYLLDL